MAPRLREAAKLAGPQGRQRSGAGGRGGGESHTELDRRKILEKELETEQRNLQEAQHLLAEQEATRSGNERNYQRVLDRLAPFQKAVLLHEENVANLRKELTALP